ncbi:MAG: pitrilysin family protein [Candidatus Krumholzibacteria bacterium]|nr:pitrilysin family protein [Candidatus Krumholzibacteria bacterium]
MLRLPPPHKVSLSSGATLLHQRNPFSPTVAFGVWIAGGSSRERDEERGLSHLLEHLVFRGTKSRDALTIAYDLESIGGQYDAFTGKEATCYHAKVLQEHFGRLIDVLADIVCRPSIPQSTFRLEKNVVQEEIRSINDSPEELAHELFYATLFNDHPLGHPVTGYLKDIARYTRDDLFAFHEKTYTASDTLLGFIGNLPLDKVVAILEEKFRFPRKRSRARRLAIVENEKRVSSRTRDEWAQSHVCVGARTVPAPHKDRHALVMIANILGGGATSRLFQSLREKKGLVYSVYSHVSFWREAGTICNFFSVDSKNLARALDILHAELADLRNGGVRDEEITSAKEQVKAGILFGVESVENRLFQVIQSEYFHGRYMRFDETIKAIEKVDRASVTEAAERYLAGDVLTYASCGRVALKGLVP